MAHSEGGLLKYDCFLCACVSAHLRLPIMPRRKRPLPSKNNTRNIFRRPKSCAKPCEYFLKQLFWHSLCLLVANINTENAEVGVEGLKCMPKKQGAPTPMCRCMTSTLEQQEINTSCVPKFGMLISPNLRKNAYFKQIQRTLWNWHLGEKIALVLYSFEFSAGLPTQLELSLFFQGRNWSAEKESKLCRVWGHSQGKAGLPKTCCKHFPCCLAGIT